MSEPDSDVAWMVEISDKTFIIARINMRKDNRQDQMGNFSREVGNARKKTNGSV